MIKVKHLALIIAALLLLFFPATNLVRPVKAIEADDHWYEYWHNYQLYGDSPQNVSSTTTVYDSTGHWWVKLALVVTVTEYTQDFGDDVVNFRVALYYDSFADEGFQPIPADYVTFYIDKDADGSNLYDQKISLVVTDTPHGYSQGYILDQSTFTSSTYDEREYWGLKALGFAVGLFYEPVSVAIDLIDLASAWIPEAGVDFQDADWEDMYAYSHWHRDQGYDYLETNPLRQYCLNAYKWFQDPDVEPSTYFGLKIWARVTPHDSRFGDYIDLPPVYLQIYRQSSDVGGCPILYVYDGTEYVCEGLLNIHNPKGMDVVYRHTLTAAPKRVKGTYLFRLVEHPQTISHIDQVKLYAILKDGTTIELPLIYAWHSDYGNVLPQLLFSDEWKVEELGANWNNGTSQSINLKFTALPPNLKAIAFIFQIEGVNPIAKW